jgi:hypothetical protein
MLANKGIKIALAAAVLAAMAAFGCGAENTGNDNRGGVTGGGAFSGGVAADGGGVAASGGLAGTAAIGGGSAGSGPVGGSVGPAPGETCASKEISTQPGIPKVDLVVDRSGSMLDFATYDSKWVEACDAVRDLVFPLTAQVAFAYHGYTWDFVAMGECPNLIEVVPAATNNADPLWQTMLNSPPPVWGSTPTGEALDAVADQIVAERAAGDNSSRTVLLITDGEPNGCGTGGGDGIAVTEAAAQRICNENIRLYAVWIGDLADPAVEAHMQNLADLGAGACMDPAITGTYYTVTSGPELQQVLMEVVTGVMDCVLQLDGKGVNPEAACADARSTVTIGGERLVCGDPNGYRLIGPTTLEFLGDACARLQGPEDLTVTAAFPCEVFIE